MVTGCMSVGGGVGTSYMSIIDGVVTGNSFSVKGW